MPSILGPLAVGLAGARAKVLEGRRTADDREFTRAREVAEQRGSETQRLLALALQERAQRRQESAESRRAKMDELNYGLNQRRTAAAEMTAARSGHRATVPTESERQVAMTIPEAAEARASLERFDAPEVLEAIAAKKGMLGNYFNSPEGRQLKQAGVQWINGVLLAKSGKAVTEQEAIRYFDQYIPMPNDDQGTLARKRQSRALAYEALKIGSGRALKEVPDSLQNPQRPQLTPAQKAKAAMDPDYRRFLEATGKLP